MIRPEEVQLWAEHHLSNLSGERCSKEVAAKVFSVVWERLGQQEFRFIPVKQRELPTNLYSASNALNVLVRRGMLLRAKTRQGNVAPTLVYGLGPVIPPRFQLSLKDPPFPITLEKAAIIASEPTKPPSPSVGSIEGMEKALEDCLAMQQHLAGLQDAKALHVSSELYQVMGRIRLFQYSKIERRKVRPELADIINELGPLEKLVSEIDFPKKECKFKILTHLHSGLTHLLKVASQKCA